MLLLLFFNYIKKLYECEQTAQEDIVDSGQEELSTGEKFKAKKSFAEFKF